jgi:hypothetical protein
MGGDAALGLNALNDSGTVTQFDDYEIVGQVRNNGTQKATFVEVIGTLYDANGTVVDCEQSYIYTSDLNPGETSSFKVTFSERATYGNVAGYHLYIQGRPTTLSLAIPTPPDRDVLPKHSP